MIYFYEYQMYFIDINDVRMHQLSMPQMQCKAFYKRYRKVFDLQGLSQFTCKQTHNN